jgi:hypothetical protein
MPNGLETFWRLLEMNFPFGGHRRCLQDQLGQDLVRGLLKAGLLSYRWLANSYPCDQPGGDGCPRQVVRQPDGTYRAVCGNRPSECDTIDLKAEDLEFLSTVPQDFLRGIARLLAIQPSRASETPVYHSFRVGSFIPARLCPFTLRDRLRLQYG